MPPIQQPDSTDYLTRLRGLFALESPVDMLAIIWRIYTPYGGGLLSYYMAQRDCYAGLLNGQYAGVLKWTSADVSEDNSGGIGALQKIYDSTNAEVNRLQGIRRASQGGSVGQMVTTAPIERDPCGPDPNARRLRGDPLRPSNYRRNW